MSEPREIYPMRTVTTKNVVDYRPRKEDPDAPEVDENLGKGGVDSVPESASSEALTPSIEPPKLTLGVQMPASPESGLKIEPPAES